MSVNRRQAGLGIGFVLGLSWLSLASLDPDPAGGSTVALGYFLGSLFAHATLAAAWTALGPGPLAWRLPLSLVWILALPAAVGINIELNGGPGDAVRVVGGSLVGQWLLLQVPLWTLSQILGFRIVRIDPSQSEADGERLQFGLPHLLLVMIFAGVVLGSLRFLVPWLAERREGVIFLFLAVAAIILTVPLLLATLMRRGAVPGTVLALLLAGAVTAVELPLLQQFGARGPKTSDFIAINVTSGLLVLLVGSLMRWHGYRLGGRKASVPA